MKEVQTALAPLIADGVPVIAGVWRATSSSQNPPTQYAVYSTTTTESDHADDKTIALRTYVYLNLWSETDPTPTRNRIRDLMYGYGFGMLEESDKGYNQPAYDTATKTYTIQWTWVWYEEVEYGTE